MKDEKFMEQKAKDMTISELESAIRIKQKLKKENMRHAIRVTASALATE